MNEAVIKPVAKTMAVASLANELLALIYDLRWLLIVTILLLLADLHFGNAESRKRKKEIRMSRMIRRTANKFVDYVCLTLVAGAIGMALQQAYGIVCVATSVTAMALCWICELNSIYGHFCFLRDINKSINFFRFFGSIVKSKNETLGNAIKDAIYDNKESEQNN